LFVVEPRRFSSILSVVAVVLFACGSATADVASTSTSDAEPETTTPPSDTSLPEAPSTTTADAQTTTTLSDRMVAPDFTLELGTGGSYTLSQSEKPVYLVFWAEW
jgi:hypothetical protein